MHQNLFLYLASILPLGIAAQWLAWRLRLPSILLLLGLGFVLGRLADVDTLLGDHADQLLFPLVSLSVAVILFEGGLTLRLEELEEVGSGVVRLVTIGAAVSWALGSMAAHWILGFDPRLAALLGAILVVTGPTVIGPLLRHVRASRRVGSLAKWEGIVIDPIGAVLAVLVFRIVLASSTGEAFMDVILVISITLLVGGGLAAATSVALVQLNKHFLVPDFLQGPSFLAVVLAVFALSNFIQAESGLLTVTILGVLLANQKEVAVRHVMVFKENLQVLLISSLFIVLASRINPNDLLDLKLGGILFLAVLIVLVRPISVMLAMLGTDVKFNERIFLSCLAPRGIVAAAVASIFSLEMVLASQEHGFDEGMLQDADRLVAVTFLVIIGTVALYGLTAGPLARRLNLAIPNPQGILFAGANPWILPLAHAVQVEGFQVLLVDTNYDHTAQARMRGLNTNCASILSEFIHEEVDLGGIGRLLAVTPNDEVNALATQEFAHIFGRANVYQLPRRESDSTRRGMAGHLHGRLLFGKDAHFEKMEEQFIRGIQVKKTTITDEFTYEDFRERYGESALVLFIVKDNHELVVCTADMNLKPTKGQKLISLISGDENRRETDKPDDANPSE